MPEDATRVLPPALLRTLVSHTERSHAARRLYRRVHTRTHCALASTHAHIVLSRLSRACLTVHTPTHASRCTHARVPYTCRAGITKPTLPRAHPQARALTRWATACVRVGPECNTRRGGVAGAKSRWLIRWRHIEILAACSILQQGRSPALPPQWRLWSCAAVR